MKTSVDKSGAPIGADALGKYGTPKCEFVAQLLRCVEPENADVGGVWVGAHPSIGEKVADALLRGGELTDALGGGPIKAVAREYRVYYRKNDPAGEDPQDYLVDHTSIIYLMGRRWLHEDRKVLARLHRRTVALLPNCGGASVSRILFGVTRAYRAGLPANELFDAAQGPATDGISQYQPEELANTVWAFATAGCAAPAGRYACRSERAESKGHCRSFGYRSR